MLCPLCRDTDLEARFSLGIEVDVCPRCRGLWLDRGELERLLDEGGTVAQAAPAPAPAPMPAPPRRDDRGYDDRDRRYDDDDDRDRRGGKRKKSKAKKLADLFEEVLDF